MRPKPTLGLALLALLSAAGGVRADEIRLKDGSKVIGTIVGFENDSFRVETSYGFALVRRDTVADINIFATKKEPEPKAKSATPPAAAAIVPAVAKDPASSPSASADPSTVKPDRAPAGASPAAAAAKSELTAPKAKTVAAAAAPPPPAVPVASPPAAPPAASAPPPPPPEPPVIRDEIRGNLYVNETYGFQMYKPPSWDLIPSARKALPDAVAALGTNDETTLLVIGREHAKDSLDAHAAATEKALAEVYENHRLLSTRRLSVAGFTAIEQRSRGTAEGRDWSVTLLTLFKGNDAYTLLGMTWANSDLIQVQENVISKTVNSLTFMTQ